MINKNNIDASELRDSLVRVYREDLPEGARFNLQISVADPVATHAGVADARPDREELTFAEVAGKHQPGIDQQARDFAHLEPAYRHDLGGAEA